MTNGYIITDTPIAVDYWHNKRKPYLRYFFLTHFHSDHTQGLESTWNRPIYCSPKTASLLRRVTGILEKYLRPIVVDQTVTIDYDDDRSGEKRSFHVTALEADHCPGAVMFYFDGWLGKILCTGDFRYESDEVINNLDRLRFQPIDHLYLDGTNWRNKSMAERLPTRNDAIGRIFHEILQRGKDELIILAMPQAKLGKERLLAAVSRRFEQKIYAEKTRLETAKVLELDHFFTDNPLETRFHLMSGTPGKVSNTVTTHESNGRQCFVLAVTSLEMWKRAIEYEEGNRYTFNRRNAVYIPYSDHSSREELERFLGLFRVRKVTLVGCREATALSLEEKIRFEDWTYEEMQNAVAQESPSSSKNNSVGFEMLETADSSGERNQQRAVEQTVKSLLENAVRETKSPVGSISSSTNVIAAKKSSTIVAEITRSPTIAVEIEKSSTTAVEITKSSIDIAAGNKKKPSFSTMSTNQDNDDSVIIIDDDQEGAMIAEARGDGQNLADSAVETTQAIFAGLIAQAGGGDGLSAAEPIEESEVVNMEEDDWLFKFEDNEIFNDDELECILSRRFLERIKEYEGMEEH